MIEKRKHEVADQLHELGVQPGDVLQVHTSFRAVRPVEGGPQGLIEALCDAIGPTGTLVMPSWGDSDDDPFDPATTPAAPDLGVVADTFWRKPGVVRSDHPFAFAAFGPHAEYIAGDPLPIPPHRPESPVGRVHDLDGKVLLLGVNHDANTTIHLTEVIAGVPYGIWHRVTVRQDGKAERIDYLENDHCCERFTLMDDWLSEGGLQAEEFVGNARARLARARDIVTTGLHHLSHDRLVFLHPAEAGCEECDEARGTIDG